MLDLASLDSVPKPVLGMALLQAFGRVPTCFPSPHQALTWSHGSDFLMQSEKIHRSHCKSSDFNFTL